MLDGDIYSSGLYCVYWTEDCGGGMSLAAVGQLPSGRQWIAPVNWVNGSISLDSQREKIARMVKILVELDGEGE